MLVPGGLAAPHGRGPDAIAATPRAPMAVLLPPPQPGRELALGGDRQQRFSKQNILFAMDGTRLSCLAGKEFGRGFTESEPTKAGTVDSCAANIGQLPARPPDDPDDARRPATVR